MHHTPNGLLGVKVSRSHATVTETAGDVVRVLQRLPEVQKIVLHKIARVRPSEKRLKCSPVPAGLRLQVRGISSIQTLYVYTSDPSSTQVAVEQCWQKLYGKNGKNGKAKG